MNTKLLSVLLISILFLVNCTSDQVDDDDDGGMMVGDLTVSNLTFSVDQDITNGTEVGTIQVSGNTGTLVFELVSQSPLGALAINPDIGSVTLADASSLNSMESSRIEARVRISDDVNQAEVDLEVFAFNIWAGSDFSFTKNNGADPTDESNQDRITDNVWITRGNEGGQIYNANTETNSSKANSPDGTQWALGTLAEIHSLTFVNFRDAVSPKDVAGVELVLYLEEDDIYLSVIFDSWSQGKQGGFAYTRSTPD